MVDIPCAVLHYITDDVAPNNTLVNIPYAMLHGQNHDVTPDSTLNVFGEYGK